MEMIMMKKLVSIALALVMIFALTANAAALISPVATEHPTAPSATTPGNPDKSSPKTGDPLWIVLGLSILALGAGAVAVKKIKE